MLLKLEIAGPASSSKPVRFKDALVPTGTRRTTMDLSPTKKLLIGKRTVSTNSSSGCS